MARNMADVIKRIFTNLNAAIARRLKFIGRASKDVRSPSGRRRRNLNAIEVLSLATAQTLVRKADGAHRASGFFLDVSESAKGMSDTVVFVTNKHVIRDARSMRWIVNGYEARDRCVGRKVIDVTSLMSLWKEHPDPNVDLAVFPFYRILKEINKKGKVIEFSPLRRNQIFTKKDLVDLSPTSEVYMVGYPDGLIDRHNNMPIYRRGVIATMPFMDYEGTPHFLVDMAVFNGSSGSPVVTVRKNSRKRWCVMRTKDSKDGEVRLVGIAAATFLHNSEGEVVPTAIDDLKGSRAVVRVPNNLGIIVKAHCLLDMIEELIAEDKGR